jgi:hypothetical protein
LLFFFVGVFAEKAVCLLSWSGCYCGLDLGAAFTKYIAHGECSVDPTSADFWSRSFVPDLIRIIKGKNIRETAQRGCATYLFRLNNSEHQVEIQRGGRLTSVELKKGGTPHWSLHLQGSEAELRDPKSNASVSKEPKEIARKLADFFELDEATRKEFRSGAIKIDKSSSLTPFYGNFVCGYSFHVMPRLYIGGEFSFGANGLGRRCFRYVGGYVKETYSLQFSATACVPLVDVFALVFSVGMNLSRYESSGKPGQNSFSSKMVSRPAIGVSVAYKVTDFVLLGIGGAYAFCADVAKTDHVSVSCRNWRAFVSIRFLLSDSV